MHKQQEEQTKPAIVGESQPAPKKPIQDVTLKSIRNKAVKAEKDINKNEVKALKAQSEATKLVPEVNKAKLQVKKLEALTAQTETGSKREQQMKNITQKAKERLAVVEKKVAKQLNKEMKAKSVIVNAQNKLEQAEEEFKAKKEDDK